MNTEPADLPRRAAGLGHQRFRIPAWRFSVTSTASIDQFPVIAADNTTTTHHKSEYIVLNAIGSSELANGKYLYSPATGRIEVHWIPGIGSENAAAPQAQLMATVINGILTRKLPWGLVMLGVFLVIAIELLGIRSLSLAVGAYLSIGTTLAIFTGGVVRALVDCGGQARRQCGRFRLRGLARLPLRLRLDRRRRHRGPASASASRATKPPSTSPIPSAGHTPSSTTLGCRSSHSRCWRIRCSTSRGSR